MMARLKETAIRLLGREAKLLVVEVEREKKIRVLLIYISSWQMHRVQCGVVLHLLGFSEIQATYLGPFSRNTGVQKWNLRKSIRMAFAGFKAAVRQVYHNA